ncbi:MAG TPA: hypothetical protein VF042_02780, partial [Gemmatimonadaceae bacterium]
RAAIATAAALAFTLIASPAEAQFGGLKDAVKKAAQKTPDVSGILQGSPPITSNIEDARFAVDSLDNFKPREAMRSFLTLQRTPSGGFVLQPGYYQMDTQSYCLHAGTYGPGGGDGYLYAPTLGPADDPVMTIVRNSVNHPDIDQHDIQVLLWAIIARSKFEDLPNGMKVTAARLLTPQMLTSLNRSALDLFPDAVLNAAYAKVPAPVRTVIEAEAKLRKMLINPTTSFSELERVAVLAGMAPNQGEKVPSGRWSLHPDGYYVRYVPYGYSHTDLQIWVPQGSPAVGKEFDPATHIAMPGNTARQRLIQSGRAYKTQ